MSQKYIGGFITKSPVAPTSSAASGMWTLDQAMQLQKQGLWPPTLPAIGSALGGGYFAGQISTAGNGVADYYLIVGPIASAQSTKQWKNVNSDTTGAASVINGLQNTLDIVAHGSSTVYPAAHFCNDLVIGGFSDWYMPAQNELEVCYYNLKPTTTNNNTGGSGVNVNAVPARASAYTSGNPAQTTATDFKSTGAEDFSADAYWTSTEFSTNTGSFQDFSDGAQSYIGKINSFNVRAIRKIAV
jgi:hypothetical protein